MRNFIVEAREKLSIICEQRRVIRLWLFGSAALGKPGSEIGDLDFLVEFNAMPPGEKAECFFGLQEDLEALFGMPTDLVEPGPISNPYFRESVEQTRIVLYDAA